MSDLLDPAVPWVHAIGRALVAFGSIEYITIRCMQEIPKDRIRRSTSAFKLVQRINLIQELLEAYDGQQYRDLHVCLDRAKKMAPTRNLIAHNPLMVDFYKKNDGSIHKVQSIHAANSKQQISLENTQGIADQAEELVTDLFIASGMVFDHLRGRDAA